MIVFKIFLIIFTFLIHLTTELNFFRKQKFGITGYLQCPFFIGGVFQVTLSTNYNKYDKNPLAKVQAKLNTSFDIMAKVRTVKKIHPVVKIYHNCFNKKTYCLGLIILQIPEQFIYRKGYMLGLYSLGKFDLSRHQSHILQCDIKRNRRTI